MDTATTLATSTDWASGLEPEQTQVLEQRATRFNALRAAVCPKGWRAFEIPEL